MEKYSNRLNIVIADDLKREFEDLAWRNRRSLSDYMRELIRNEIKRSKANGEME